MVRNTSRKKKLRRIWAGRGKIKSCQRGKKPQGPSLHSWSGIGGEETSPGHTHIHMDTAEHNVQSSTPWFKLKIRPTESRETETADSGRGSKDWVWNLEATGAVWENQQVSCFLPDRPNWRPTHTHSKFNSIPFYSILGRLVESNSDWSINSATHNHFWCHSHTFRCPDEAELIRQPR